VGALQHRENVCGSRLITGEQFRALLLNEREREEAREQHLEQQIDDTHDNAGEEAVELEEVLSAAKRASASASTAELQLRTRIPLSALSVLAPLFPDMDAVHV
jgi:hypothetical protein